MKPKTHSVTKIWVFTSKEDSALLYHLLEAHEGIAAYSTIDSDVVSKQILDRRESQQIGEESENWKKLESAPLYANRVVELLVPVGFDNEISELLQDWADWVFILE